MIPFFTPDKSVAPVSLRAVEQWQLTHEGDTVVTNSALTVPGVRGRTVFNSDDGLYYFYDGARWLPKPGQLLRAGGVFPVAASQEINSPQSADAGHDVGVSANANIPTLGGLFSGPRVLLQVSTPGFVYAVDPGADAVFQIQITDNANNVLVSAESHFFTGRLTASGVTAAKWFNDNTVLTVGTFGLKVRVASTNATQAYGTRSAAGLPLTFEAWVF